MKKTFKSTLLTLCILSAGLTTGGVATATESPTEWSYSSGKASPFKWADLNPAYQTCRMGREQSPINFEITAPNQNPAVQFDYHLDNIKLVNTGRTIEGTVSNDSRITLGTDTFTLSQFNFHAPSEHTVDGQPFDMSIHFEHINAKNQMAIIEVFFKVGQANPAIDALFNALPKQVGESKQVTVPVRLSDLLPASASYYTYQGSQTTPPCAEGVKWIVFQNPIELSDVQLQKFKTLYSGNARPLQIVYGRPVYKVNP